MSDRTMTIHTLSTRDRARAIEAAASIDPEQLRQWIELSPGREETVDVLGFGQVMNDIGRAAFRHRVAVDADAEELCVHWDGKPPSLRFDQCPTMGGPCDPGRCVKHGCQGPSEVVA